MNIADNIRMEGYLEGNDELEKVVVKYISETFFDIVQNGIYDDSKYNPEYLPIFDELEKIEYVIGFQPQVQAWENGSGNIIGINLFNMVILAKICEFRNVVKLITSNNAMSYEKLMEIFAFERHTKDNVQELIEILNLFEQYDIKSKNGKVQIKWDARYLLASDEAYKYSLIVMKLIYHHEMAHWHFSKFNNEAKWDFILMAKKELQNFIEEYRALPEIYNILLSYFSIDKQFMEGINPFSWEEEIAVDAMSFTSMYNLCKTQIERRDVCISFGLYYALLRMQELYNNPSGTLKVTYTHPPIQIREAVVERLFAKQKGVDLDYFRTRIGSSWYIIHTYYGIAIDNYIEGREKDGQVGNN